MKRFLLIAATAALAAGPALAQPVTPAPEKDANGETYYSSWFDLYRIENGKIAEHWDPMLKSDPKIDPNDKKL